MDQLTAMRVFVRVAERGSFSPGGRRTRAVAACRERARRGAREAPRRPPAPPHDAQGRADRRGRRLSRARTAHPGGTARGRGGVARHAFATAGQAACRRAGHVRSIPAAAGAAGVHATLSADRTRGAAQRPRSSTSSARASTSPCASATCSRRAWRARRIASINLVTCASPAYLADHGEPRTPDDLRDHRLLGTTQASGAPPEWSFPAPYTPRRLGLKFAMLFNAAAGPVVSAAAGLGITHTADLIIAEYVARGATQADPRGLHRRRSAACRSSIRRAGTRRPRSACSRISPPTCCCAGTSRCARRIQTSPPAHRHLDRPLDCRRKASNENDHMTYLVAGLAAVPRHPLDRDRRAGLARRHGARGSATPPGRRCSRSSP